MPAKISGTNKPLDTLWRQQKLSSFSSLICKPSGVVALFLSLGLAFLIIGVLIVHASSEVVEVTVPYESASSSCCYANCSGEGERMEHNPCYVNFTIPESMDGPVYVYYRLTDYYANHKQYVRSRDDAQLNGKTGLAPNDLDCNYDKNFAVAGLEETMFGTYEVPSALNNASNIISPCGLIALSLFTDTFRVTRSGMAGPVPIEETGIAWNTDRSEKFKNSADGSTGNNFEPFKHWKQRSCSELPTPAEQTSCLAYETDARAAEAPFLPGWCFPGSGYCAEDEHFMIWMRTAALKDSRKLFGRLPGGLAAADYTLEISSGDGSQQRLYPVDSFDGSKEVVISTVSWLNGGRNSFLGVAYITVGAMFILFATAFFAKDRSSPRRLGQLANKTNVA